MRTAQKARMQAALQITRELQDGSVAFGPEAEARS
jgi:hypothetical protein